MLKDGTYPLVFQILHNRRKKVVYTKIRIREPAFDPQTEKVRACEELSVRAAQHLNRELIRERSALRSKIDYFQKHGFEFDVSEVDGRSPRQSNVYVLQYMYRQMQLKEQARHFGIAAAYKSTGSSFCKFLRSKDVRVCEMTPLFVRRYGEFLQAQQLASNTIAFYMRNLRTIYNKIVADGYLPAAGYPFKLTRTAVCKTVKRALSREDMVRLSRYSFSRQEQHLEFARDLFLFSFYTRGMSLVDIIFLKKSNLEGPVMRYARHKTGQQLRITVTEPLATLLAKYNNDSEYLVPILDDTPARPLYDQYRRALARINRNLKGVGNQLGFPIPLTTYVARHTWATLAKESGAPVSLISEGLGHTSEKITRIYLKEFDTRVLDRVNELITTL